jgi:hypothetical protein
LSRWEGGGASDKWGGGRGSACERGARDGRAAGLPGLFWTAFSACFAAARFELGGVGTH